MFVKYFDKKLGVIISTVVVISILYFGIHVLIEVVKWENSNLEHGTKGYDGKINNEIIVSL